MVRCCLKGDYKSARLLNHDLMGSYEVLFSENNPSGVKAVLAEMGLIQNTVRLPLVPLSDGLTEKAREYLGRNK
jgi:4-hydroxy-tetrahydrodipicolinate synthase